MGGQVAPIAEMLRRTVYLFGDISEENAGRVMRDLLGFVAENDELPVTVLVNSAGGRLEQAMGLADLIRGLPCPVQTVVIGWALSAAALVAACGTRGLRYSYPSARFMLHRVRSDIEARNVLITDQEAWVHFQTRLERAMLHLVSAVTGQTEAYVRKRATGDHYLTAAEAVNFGLVDRVLTRLNGLLRA